MTIEKRKNKVIIISSPSGAGKTTLCKLLIKKMDNIKLSISYTTRPKRINEVNGRDYFFVNKNKFLLLKKQNFFIETAKVFNHYYGSPYKNIKSNKLSLYNFILFDIDWQGAQKLRKKFKKDQIIDFFILPPNKKELKRRLEKRGRDNKEEISMRLSLALSEINHHTDYKYILVNDKINETIKNLMSIIDYYKMMDKLKDKLIKNLKVFK